MNITDFTFKPLSTSTDLSNFDCGDLDINDFLIIDALSYQEQRMANTYLFFDDPTQQIVAYFSASSDNLKSETFENRTWNRLHRKTKIPNPKRIRNYPSVKVGRLGINSLFHKKGLGSQLLDFIKVWIFRDAQIANRFILVDAYNKASVVEFYQKNDFTLLLSDDVEDNTRLMYFDLMRLV